jgi:signal recognition particle GTPase
VGSVAQLGEYRKTVEDFEAINASRSLRIASGRLGKALAGVERLLKGFEKVEAGVVRELDRRLAKEKGKP